MFPLFTGFEFSVSRLVKCIRQHVSGKVDEFVRWIADNMVLTNIVCLGILGIFCLSTNKTTHLHAVGESVDTRVFIDILTHQGNIPGNEFSDFIQFPNIVAYKIQIYLSQGFWKLESRQIVAYDIRRYTSPQIVA